MARVVDLTLILKPGTRGVAFEPKYNVAEHGWNAQTLSLYSHSGTHMGAALNLLAIGMWWLMQPDRAIEQARSSAREQPSKKLA